MTKAELRQVVESLSDDVLEVIGSLDVQVERPVAIDASHEARTITFCNLPGTAGVEAVKASGSTAVLCTKEIAEQISEESLTSKTLIVVDRPRLAFIRLIERLFAPPRPTGVHSTATVEPHTTLGEDVYIGPYAYVAGDAIGSGTVIHGHVHIYPGTDIGRNVTIHGGTVIGADGFGYEPNEHGVWEKFHHLGAVVIEDDVEIGANTCIDRGALGDTLIRRGAKIDNLVYIAHNVIVGENAVVIAHASIAGSVEIGEHSWIAPSSVIRDKVRVGKKAVVGLGAVVTQNVPDGVTVVGVPAKPHAGRQDR